MLSLKAAADLINSSVINWNGDDAVVLKNNGIVIDVIGQVGVDPGSAWGSGMESTQDHTLRRKESICSGDTDSSDEFDPALEWDGYEINTFDGFGAHSANCGVIVEDTAPAVSSTSPANGSVDVAIDANIEITFSEAVDTTDPWFSITCGSTGSHTASISGGPTTFTLNPDTDFANLESCTVTVYAAQITDQDTEDPPDNMVADYVFNFTTEDVLVVNTDIIINELDADQVSTDSKEFVELYDYGVGNTDLSGLVLVLYNGSGDASYQAFDLDGYSTDPRGYFVLCGDAAKVPNCDLDVSPDTNLIQNGADAAALYVGDAADFPNGTGVTTASLVDAIVYDTSDSDDPGLLALLNPGQPQINEQGGGDGTGHSNQRCPNGSGGPLNTDTYDQYKPTPGAKNICVITPDVIINELDADQSGTDSAEFIELFDGGAGNTDLTDLVLVLYNGNGDASYEAFDLDGHSTDSGGYFVLCGDAANVPNCDLDVSPDSNLIQNGADAAALYYGDEADFPNGTGVTHDGLLDALVYDTSDSDDTGLLSLLNPTQQQVNENGEGKGYAHSNQRCPNGSGGPNNTYTFAQFDPTPGAVNTCGIECGLPTTAPIHDIQGPGFDSPYDGIKVDVEGIVTGDFQDGKSGFYIQEPDANIDTDPATSEGIFVYSTSLDVNPGDHVRVTGYVDEYYNLTEITGVSHLEICSSGNSVTPTVISLPLVAISDLEAYEGMLVTFPQPLVISEYYEFGRYGEIVVSLDRQFQPTAIFDPGSPEAAQLLAENLLSRITIDDGRGSENPDPALHPNGLTFDLSNLFRGGDQLENVTGIVDYNFGKYKIQQTSNPVFTSLNPRTAAPDDVGGSLKIASFNVLNYFTTLDDGVNDICGPLGNLECRGADTPEEFTRQRDKIIAAIDALDADVVGLIEIENNEYEAVEDLVNGLNAAAGAGTYAYVDTGYLLVN